MPKKALNDSKISTYTVERFEPTIDEGIKPLITDNEQSPQVSLDAEIRPLGEGLTQTDLGRRLGYADGSGVSKALKRMTSDEFRLWSKEKDPDDLVWEKRDDGKFYPVE